MEEIQAMGSRLQRYRVAAHAAPYLVHQFPERCRMVLTYLENNPEVASSIRTGAGIRSMVEEPQKWPDVEHWWYQHMARRASRVAAAPPVEESPEDVPDHSPERAQALKAIYDGLPAEERARLLAEAKTGTADMFWERLDNPLSPVSFALWDLVARDYGE